MLKASAGTGSRRLQKERKLLLKKASNNTLSGRDRVRLAKLTGRIEKEFENSQTWEPTNDE